MEDNQQRSIGSRAASAMFLGFKAALSTIWLLLRIVIPITLAVALLDWCGALAWISRTMAPVMTVVGLPGGAFLVFVSSVFLNIYGAIAVAHTLSLDMRSMTILAIMCLTAHNLVVETAAMKKTGSSSTKMALLRIIFAFGAAFVFNILVPTNLRSVPFSSAVPAASAAARLGFFDMLVAWGVSTAPFALEIALIVLGVMVVQRFLEEFKAMDFLAKLFAPIMRFFGLRREASFIWIVINIVGYAYGAGIVE